jgi:uncharacterized RDD family membrane protein YckC
MKCPKCGYLGFETVDRCRNCGYDFSLAAQPEASVELPLQERNAGAVPLHDFDLGVRDTAADAGELDLDRVLGAPGDTPAVVPSGRDQLVRSGLPLFSPEHGEAPLITKPRPVRPPLSVRRSTPDVARVRPRSPRAQPDSPRAQPDEAAPVLVLEPAMPEVATERPIEPAPAVALELAGRLARLFAGLVDVLLIGAIDTLVIYLTLAVAGVEPADIQTLSLVPLVAFLLLLNGGYLIAFTVANGQTIGKMIAGVRVVSDEGERVDVGRAVLRAIGCLVSLLTAGIGYLPAFFSTDARALQDRFARTRVVRVR